MQNPEDPLALSKFRVSLQRNIVVTSSNQQQIHIPMLGVTWYGLSVVSLSYILIRGKLYRKQILMMLTRWYRIHESPLP